MDGGTDTNMLDEESSGEVEATPEEENNNEVSNSSSKTCHICQLELPTVMGRMRHEKACAKLKFDYHRDDWPCSVCNYGGATPQDIHKHELVSHGIHPGQEPNQGEASKNEELPRTIYQRTRGITCMTCGKLVSQNDYDKQHGRHCRVGTGRKQNKTQPKESEKGDPALDTDNESGSSHEDPLTCKKCGTQFESALDLRRHVDLCTGNEWFVFGCTVCGRNMGDVSRMLLHEKKCQREVRVQDMQLMKYLTPVPGSDDDSEDEHTTANGGIFKSQWCNLCGVKLSHYRIAYRKHRWRCRQREEKILYDLQSFNTQPAKQKEVSAADSSGCNPCINCKGNDAVQMHTPPAVSSSLNSSPTEDTVMESEDTAGSITDDTLASCSNVNTPASCSSVDTAASCSNDTAASCSNMDTPSLLCSKPVFQCTVCELGTCTMRRLEFHMEVHRGGTGGTFICHSCNLTFHTKTLLQIHYRSHARRLLKDTSLDTLSIPVNSDSTADTNKALLPQLQEAILHKKRFYSELTFKQPLHRIISLGKARHEHKGKEKYAKYQLYQCRLCDYSSRYLSCMQQHAVWHCRRRDICTICGKELSYHNETEHYRRHEEQEVGGHSCDICGKVLLNPKMLALHMGKLHGSSSQSVLCDICGHRAKDKGTLAAHKLTHSTVKRYQCTICGKAFIRSDYLFRHTKSHLTDKDRPFKCERCGKGFTRKPYLKLHLDKQVCSLRHQDENKEKKTKKAQSKAKTRKTGQHYEPDDDRETTDSEKDARKGKKRGKKRSIKNDGGESEIGRRNVRLRKKPKTITDPEFDEESVVNLGDGDQETRDSEISAPKESQRGKKRSLKNYAGRSEINRHNIRPRKNAKTILGPDLEKLREVTRRNKIAKLAISSENKKGPNARNTKRSSKLKTSASVVDIAEAGSANEGPESPSASRSGVYADSEAEKSLRDSDSANKAIDNGGVSGENNSDTTNNINKENSNSRINLKLSLVLKPALIKKVTSKLITKRP